MKKRVTLLAAAVALSMATEVPVAAAAGPVEYRAIAVSGQQAPAADPGVVYRQFYPPAVNDTGGVAYVATLGNAGGTTEIGKALYAGPDTGPLLVAREGTQVPGTPDGTTFARFDGIYPVLNNRKQIAFDTQLRGPLVPDGSSAILAGTFGAPPASSPQLVARTFDQPTGTAPGTVYIGVGVPSFNDLGQVSYGGGVGGGGRPNEGAMFAGPIASPQVVVRQNDPAPGMPAGVTYLTFGSSGALSNNGQFAYAAALTGPGVTPANQWAIYSGPLGSPQLVARGGDAAPGAPAGVVYEAFDEPKISDNGHVVYLALLAGAGVTERNVGIFAGPAASPRLIARMGSAVPGTSGLNYTDFGSHVDVNDRGQTTFVPRIGGGGVTQANDFPLVLAAADGTATFVAREGAAAPGTQPGVAYGIILDPDLNNAGQVAFVSTLTGAGVTAANDRGLFLYDPTLGPILIAREGDLFDVGGGDLRTISPTGIAIADSPFYNRSSLGDDGRLAFALYFTDGTSGVFVATVPEPGCAAGVVAAAALLLRRRRGREIGRNPS